MNKPIPTQPNDMGAEPTWAERHAGATRDIYRRTLLELAQEREEIFCLDSDMGGLEETFAVQVPEQYVDLGIAEANLMTVAAGLAAAGKVPFVNTMAGFASCRACEQVKVDIAYNNLPVKIVGTHSGVSAGHLGPTHHSLEDLAIMRSIPNMTVIVPADTVETKKAVELAAKLPGPVYIRLGRKATGLVYEEDYAFEVGKAVTLRAGSDVTLVATGSYPVLAALAAHEALKAHGISARVLNVHTIKPIDADALVAAARETGGLITVEEHSVIGGLGSAVAEVVAEHAPAKVVRIGFADLFCEQVGDQQDLLQAYGVTAERLVEAALQLVQSAGAK